VGRAARNFKTAPFQIRIIRFPRDPSSVFSENASNGQVVLEGESPKELRPSRLSIAVPFAGFVFYVYIIVRALASFFGKAS
jgi:hypothetical protein